MKKAPDKCVFKRENGTYYFRRAVPKELVGRIGKREWKVSLKTTEYGRAHAEGVAIFERTERQIAQLRGTARSADPVEAGLPASDEQVEAIAAAVFSRSATMTIGRFEGHVVAGRVQGNAAAETLQKLEAEWASLQASTPLGAIHTEFLALLPKIEQRANRDIDPMSALGVKLRRAHWQMMKSSLRNRIAQLKGDADELAALNSSRRPRPDLKLLVELFRKHRTADWAPSTHQKFDAVSAVLLDILGPSLKLSAIDREVGRDLHKVLHDLPPNYKKRRQLAGLSAREAAAVGREKGLPKLGRKTLEDYLNHISSVFEFAVHEDLIKGNPVKGLKATATKTDADRVPFTQSDLVKLFSAPIFTGCVDDEKSWREPARTQVRRGRYWVPLVALHTGMRLNEVCCLRKGDIKFEGSVRYIEVSDSGGRRLKTENARRVIPMHPQLLKLGFWDWVQSTPGGDDADLFPELQMDAKGSRTNVFSKWFGRLRKSVGITDAGKTFHSFRHLFTDLLREASVSMENSERIMGWTNNHVQRGYGRGPSLNSLSADMNKIDLSMASIEHLIPLQKRQLSE